MATRQKKKESATGFRNGKLFCFNCGQAFSYKLPAPVQQFADQCRAFDKLHLHCEKTWVKPVPSPEGKTELENVAWWIANGEHGISSCTMVYYISEIMVQPRRTDGSSPSFGSPSDADDFRRCHELLQAVPQYKTQLHKVKGYGKPWPALVDNWDKLTEMFESQKYKEMSELMKSLGC